MNYEVVPLGGDPRIELNGVRFRGKNFMYWRKKESVKVKQVVAVFEEKDANIPIQDGMVVLSLKGLRDYSDLKEAIVIFKEQFKGQNFVFRFVVNDEQERQIAEQLGKELGLTYTLDKAAIEQSMQKMEESLQKENNVSASGSQMIEKYDNGQLKQYTVKNDVIYENYGLLNSEEEKNSLLREWMKDPVKVAELSQMTDKERDEMLMQAIMANRKEHHLESASVQNGQDKLGEVAKETASREDGLVNSELGVVQNSFSNSNRYSVVEKNGENVQVVNPNVINSRVSSQAGGGLSSSGDNRQQTYGYVNENIETQPEQQRNIEQVFYVDEEYHLYDNFGKMIGQIGVDGYMPDYSNNTILKNGQVIGYIGDYKDLGKETSMEYSKPKVRVYKKEEYHPTDTENKSAAFVSLPVIIFVLSALLLVASIVLLFVIE